MNLLLIVNNLQALFLFLYKSFSDILMEPLRDTEGSLHPSREADEMAIENEDTSTMELDNEGGIIPQKRCRLF